MSSIAESQERVAIDTGYYVRFYALDDVAGDHLSGLESFLDAGDAIKRRREANRIYRDLMAERVSSRAAVAMLQALTKRQKGGWLEKSFARKGSNRDA